MPPFDDQFGTGSNTITIVVDWCVVGCDRAVVWRTLFFVTYLK
jgi:hypothetical protein